MNRPLSDPVHPERPHAGRTAEPAVFPGVGGSAFVGGGAAAPVLESLLAAAAAVTGSLSAAAGGLLAARRLGGGIAAAPGPEAVLAVCGAGLVLVAVADVAERRGGPVLPAALARVGLLLGVAAVALPLPVASPGAAVVAIAALLVTGAAVLATPTGRLVARLRGRPAAGRAARADTAAPALVPEAAPAVGVAARSGIDDPSGAVAATGIPPAADIMQRFERRTLADGCERVDGMIRVAVPQGSRLGWGHVGFCPPFSASPAVDVATGYDGVEATVTAAEVLPWGVRIEVRLDEPAEESLDIPVDVVARTAA